jgi:hypothetical protein
MNPLLLHKRGRGHHTSSQGREAAVRLTAVGRDDRSVARHAAGPGTGRSASISPSGQRPIRWASGCGGQVTSSRARAGGHGPKARA